MLKKYLTLNLTLNLTLKEYDSNKLMKAYPEYKTSGIEWLGNIPSHWACHKLKYHISISNGSDPKSDGDIPVYGAGELPFKTCGEYKIGPTVLLGRKGSVDIPHWVEGKYWNVDTAFDTKSKADFNLKYFWYIANCLEINLYKSTTAVPSMTQASYDNMRIPVPTQEEQHLIAEYLDEKTAKIDALVAEKQAQVEDLRKYRTSLITETVTCGINPNAPLRHSGIDWIGSIPEHWSKTKLKYYIDINSGDAIPRDVISNSGKFPVYGGGDKIGYTNKSNVDSQTIIIGRVGARCGCVTLLNNPAWATDNSLICVTSQYPNFIARLLEAANLNRLNESNAQPLITATIVKDLEVALPPLKEQQEIAEFLDEKTAKIDALIDELTQQLDELALYRKAVISEAVTGKVDVRDWKPED